MSGTVLFLLLAAPALGAECVFYLRPSPAGLEARLYDPERDRDAAPRALAASSGVLWDRDFKRVWWLDGRWIRRAWWLGAGKAEPPIELPPELRAPETWWLGADGLMLVRGRGASLELWEYQESKGIWELNERRPRSSSVFFEWSSARKDTSLASRLESMRAGAYLAKIEFSGAGATGAGFLRFQGAPRCGLKLRVASDAQGAHAALPLVHWCEGSKRERTLLAAPHGRGFAPVAFAESGRWLLVGKEPAMDGARVVRLADGATRRVLPEGASQAAWVACPR